MELKNVDFAKFQLIQKALVFSEKKHADQKDDEGNPYFETHIKQVFEIISLVTNDYKVLCASILHDTIEDTDTNYEELCEEFSKDIADLVMEVTHEGKKDNYGYYFPRLKTLEGILIKFADRLSNLSRMNCWDEKRKIQYLKRSRFWKIGDQNGI